MRIAFTLIGNNDWIGGRHYLKNLLISLYKSEKKIVRPILFVGFDIPEHEIELLSPYVENVIRDRCLTRMTPEWFIRPILRRIFDRDIIFEKVLKRYDIDAIFQSGLLGKNFSLPVVNWIPDFQHIHIPEIFTAKDIKLRNKNFYASAEMSQRLILSSQSAKKDFEILFPEYRERAEVLNFVAHIPEDVYGDIPWEIIKKYDIPKKFFHLPNQFWKHKNHITVIHALKLLKKQGKEVCIVCTGNANDYRNPGHFDFLKNEIRSANLEKNIYLLGIVPLAHLYSFVRQSIAVINPSFFEGWSTTVEEAKSLGKKVLLSDIPVHREQNSPDAVYFNPKNTENLAEKMLTIWSDKSYSPGPDKAMETIAHSLSVQRVADFSEKFVNIFNKAIHNKSSQ